MSSNTNPFASNVYQTRRLSFVSLLLLLCAACFILLSRTPVEVAQASRRLPPNGTLYISEFMASNGATLADEDGNQSDWIELYNAGSEEVNLEGWYLTDDASDLSKWRFPATILAANHYLVVFASNKDRVGAELHTNFKLKSDGEYLALVEPDGATVVADYGAQYPAQFRDVSYGLDASLNARYFTIPTPGQMNGLGQADLGPIVSQAAHMPLLPTDMDDITVTVSISPTLSSLNQVRLHYQIMYSETVSVTMADDGTHGDGAAEDGVYGALIPASASAAGEMVRYFITADDTEGRTSRWPLFQDPATSPQYFGTVIADPEITSQLPVLYWFVQDPVAAESAVGTRASLFYDGRFYDNVFVRLRGATSGGYPKKSFKFRFNRGAYFHFSPDEASVKEFNLNTTYSDSAYIRQPLAWESYRDAGSPYSISFPMRIHQNGAFYSVAIFVEQPDETYLERQGLDPNGALYKMTWNTVDSATSGVDKKTRLHEDHSDLQALVDGLQLQEPARTAYLFDQVNVPEVINYLATMTLLEDWTVLQHNNYLYRDSDGTGQWLVLPWDKDLTFGNVKQPNDPVYGHPFYGSSDYPATYGSRQYWNRLTDAMYDTPQTREMYLRRLRSLMDQLLQPSSTPTSERYYEQRLDQFLAQMTSDAEEDRAIWGSYWGGWQSFDSAIAYIKRNYLRGRRTHLYETFGPAGEALIPEQQAADITIEFGPYDVMLPHRNPDEEYLTLRNAHHVAVDLSGWQLRLQNQFDYTFQPGVVIPAGGTLYVTPNLSAFRQRATSPTGGEALFVQSGYNGHISHSQGTLHLYNATGTLIASQSLAASPLGDKLIISEINYHPPSSESARAYNGDEFEFIELKNVYTTTLDLSGVTFMQPISYTFPLSTTVEPNQHLVLARHAAQFSTRYPNVALAGVYDGELPNDGASVTLLDRQKLVITSVEYDDDFPWPATADGEGYTLVRERFSGETNNPCRWRASTDLYGSPGVEDPVGASPSCEVAGAGQLLITELNYNPPADNNNEGNQNAVDGDEFEFIELKNVYSSTLSLGGLHFTAGIEYTFPITATLAANQMLVLVRNREHFMRRYPDVAIAGSYQQRLANSGESITLSHDDGAIITSVEYDDQFPWPERADGEGYTLVPYDTTAYNNHPCRWRASTNLYGSPGVEDPVGGQPSCEVASAGQLLISELNYNPPPDKDNKNDVDGDEFEFIELKNVYSSTLSLGGLHFSAGIDYTFPMTATLAPNEMLVLVRNAKHFMRRYPDVAIAGSYEQRLSNSGDRITLSHDDGAIITSVEYDDHFPWPERADGEGYTLVPYDTTAYNNHPCRWRASSNLYGSPGVEDPVGGTHSCEVAGAGQLLITELNYNPPPDKDNKGNEGAIDGDEFEFIELKNVYSSTLSLGGLHFTAGIEYTFPITATLAANQMLVLVRNREHFMRRYPDVAIAGSYQQRLANSGESITLSHDDGAIITSVEYDDQFPWPERADGEGYTLVPYDTTAYNNHPCRWRASTNLYGSPGVEDPVGGGPSCEVASAGQLLISELNYNPPPDKDNQNAVDGDEFEFIELKNVYSSTLSLGGLHFSAGIDYTFPITATLAANEMLVLVRNAKHFMRRYPDVAIAGSYEQRLANSGETITLSHDDGAIITSVEYDDQFPWPERADGEGYTLVPYDTTAYNNHPCRWRASTDLYGSPGVEDPAGGTHSCEVAGAGQLLISELNYNPPPDNNNEGNQNAVDGDEFEFIELKNVYSSTLSLGGLHFSAGIDYTFPITATLAANEMLVLVRNAKHFMRRYPDVAIAGSYQQKLANSGETVTLSHDDGAIITSVEYDDHFPWPERADGEGYTLVRETLSGEANNACMWRASTHLYGSPGMEDPTGGRVACRRLYLPMLLSRE